ncbi:MAG: translation initiation factor IF-2 [Candidatus Micrarchaeia archaeon]
MHHKVRQPIVTVMGHVDHGKTSLLDKIRETTVHQREKGGITQHIGASEVPIEVIERISGNLIKQLGARITLPGLLFIDTPGHEAFTNLRRRGGSVADIALLVVDVTQGFQPQTVEAIEILREYKTPFIVVANKIDLLRMWSAKNTTSFIESLMQQSEITQQELEKKIYEMVGKLHEFGFSSERFDRVRDFTRELLIVPVSAKTGEGISELLMYTTGLCQKFLEKRLVLHEEEAGVGSILEVKEEKTLGTTVDVILYDGRIAKGDMIAFGTLNGVATTKVRALLKPKPLDEIRDPKEKFSYVDEVHAAAGVKIYAPNLAHAVPGSTLMVVRKDVDKAKKMIAQEIEEILVETDSNGVIVKADTLGSVEALVKLLASESVSVKRANVGPVTKKDVVDAAVVRKDHPLLGTILAFNVPVSEDVRAEAKKNDVEIIEENIVYMLIEKYKKWMAEERERLKLKALSDLVMPVEIKVLPRCCFRASKPAIFGVEVLAGVIKPGYILETMDGREVGEVKSIQKDKETLEKAERGMQVAIAVDGAVYGRHFSEGDVLRSKVPREHLAILKERYSEYLPADVLALIEEYRKIGKAF